MDDPEISLGDRNTVRILTLHSVRDKYVVNSLGIVLCFRFTQVAILDAVHRLEERVICPVSEVERVREENEVLRRQLKTVNSQLKGKDGLSTEIDKLNRTIMEREVSLTMTRDELAHERQKRNLEQDTNRRLTRSLRKKQEEVATKDKDIATLKSEIEDRDKQVLPTYFVSDFLR